MNFEKAFSYPFRSENWKSTLLIPGAFVSATAVIQLLIGILAFVISAFAGSTSHNAGSTSFRILIECFRLLAYIPIIVILTPVYGYYWNLMGNWKANGMDAPAPEWKGNVKKYFYDGLHYYLAILVMTIPTLFAIFSLGFLSPFVIAPLYGAAEERRIGAVFNKLGNSMSLASERYLPVLGVVFVMFGIGLLSIIPSILLIFTIVGAAMLTHYLHMVGNYFITDAFNKPATVAIGMTQFGAPANNPVNPS